MAEKSPIERQYSSIWCSRSSGRALSSENEALRSSIVAANAWEGWKAVVGTLADKLHERR